jgi:oligopeptide transport system permease protein
MAVVAQGAKPAAITASSERVRTPLGDAWQQFRKKRIAMISLIYVIFLILVALTADIQKNLGFIDDPVFQHRVAGTSLSRLPPLTCTQDPRRMEPQWCFAFGSDGLGRDMLSRLIYGSRVSLLVGFLGAGVAFFVGIVYGTIAGYYGGKIDNAMMRVVDFLYSIPELPIIIVMQSVFLAFRQQRQDDPASVSPFMSTLLDIDNSMGGLFFLFIVIGLLSWIGIARLARAQVLSYKQKEFVEAARAIGARNSRIIFSLLVIGAQSVAGFILTEATLSFLGLGIQEPTPSWGQMIEGIQEAGFLSPYVHLLLVPAIPLTITTLAFAFIGDGLRDAFDPKLRGE